MSDGVRGVRLDTLEDLGAMGQAMHPYPTVAESYRKAADQWRRGKLTRWCVEDWGWGFSVPALTV
ncbi:MAG TPA: hypothetical protein VMK53_05115 [Gemmatimonadales bacterium]|nr:hypothetical protein [Gemmatimonadales bacterium]